MAKSDVGHGHHGEIAIATTLEAEEGVKGSNEPFRGWIASLSNGETVHEWQTPVGERTSWKHLIARCHAENLRITQLRLQIGGITIHTLRNAEGYIVLNQIRHSAFTNKGAEIRGIGVVSGNAVVMIWADKNKNVWQEIYPLDDMLPHTTLRDEPELV
jgi:hypothetical protein